MAQTDWLPWARFIFMCYVSGLRSDRLLGSCRKLAYSVRPSHTHTRTHKRTLCSVKFCFCLLFETFPRKLFRVLDSCRAHRARSDCVAFNKPFCSVSFQVFPATSNSNLLPLPLPVKILWKMRMRAASFQLKKVRDQHRIASPRSATPLSNQLFCTYVYANFCANK